MLLFEKQMLWKGVYRTESFPSKESDIKILQITYYAQDT